MTNQQKLIAFCEKFHNRHAIRAMRQELRAYLGFDTQREAIDFINDPENKFKVIEIIQDRWTSRITVSIMIS